MAKPNFSSLTTKSLRVALKNIRRRDAESALTVTEVNSWGLRDTAEALLEALEELPKSAWEVVLEALIEDRQHHHHVSPELVWTGPGPRQSKARDTWIVLKHLLREAEDRVLLAGYSFDHGADIFKGLHDAMVGRGVSVDFFMDIKQDRDLNNVRNVPRALTMRDVQEHIAEFLQGNWPFGPPLPKFYVDARILEDFPQRYTSLHAKCCVIDNHRALVTSANFTQRGQQRNIEAGVLIEDGHFARTLVEQFRMSLGAKLFVEVSPPESTHP